MLHNPTGLPATTKNGVNLPAIKLYCILLNISARLPPRGHFQPGIQVESPASHSKTASTVSELLSNFSVIPAKKSR
jgi:hypothetical protein